MFIYHSFFVKIPLLSKTNVYNHLVAEDWEKINKLVYLQTHLRPKVLQFCALLFDHLFLASCKKTTEILLTFWVGHSCERVHEDGGLLLFDLVTVTRCPDLAKCLAPESRDSLVWRQGGCTWFSPPVCQLGQIWAWLILPSYKSVKRRTLFRGHHVLMQRETLLLYLVVKDRIFGSITVLLD